MKVFLTLSATLLMTIGVGNPVKPNAINQKDNVNTVITLNQPTSWSEYNLQTGQFIVRFPGEPEQKTSNINIADVNTQWNILTFKNGTEHYTVAYTDLTPDLVKLGADTVIDSIENTLEKEFNWTALNGRGKGITVGEYPAREIIGTRDDQISIVRLVLADQRLYAVMVTSENLSNIAQFLESFEVQPWQAYLSETGRFKVDLPMLPGEEQDSTELSGKLFEWNLIEARNFNNPNDSYSVGYTDLAPEDLENGTESLLNQVGANLLGKFSEKTVIQNGKPITLNGNPGISYIMALDSNQVFVVNFYVAGQRLYGISAASDNIGNINKFLDSFEIQ